MRVQYTAYIWIFVSKIFESFDQASTTAVISQLQGPFVLTYCPSFSFLTVLQCTFRCTWSMLDVKRVSLADTIRYLLDRIALSGAESLALAPAL